MHLKQWAISENVGEYLIQMMDKSSLLKSHSSLYLEFIPKDGLFHKMLLLLLSLSERLLTVFVKIQTHFSERNTLKA